MINRDLKEQSLFNFATCYRVALVVFILSSITLKVNAQILPPYGDSRTGTTGWQFLKIAPDARSVAMGESYAAVTDDVSALWWNPAGITRLDSQKLHIQLSHTDYFSDVNLEWMGLVWRLSESTLLGFGMEYLNSGEMPVTTEFQPFGTGQTFRATNLALAATLARKLTDNFSFGTSARYVNESIAGVQTHNAVFDFGFQYDIGLSNMRFAVGLNNFGFNTNPQGSVIVETLDGPQIREEWENISVPSVFRLGIAWDPILDPVHRLTISGQLNHPTDNNETYGLGVEYAWKELLYLRTGYLLGQDETGFPSAGFGVYLKRRFGQLRIDYGYGHKSNLGLIHRIGLGFSLL